MAMSRFEAALGLLVCSAVSCSLPSIFGDAHLLARSDEIGRVQGGMAVDCTSSCSDHLILRLISCFVGKPNGQIC